MCLKCVKCLKLYIFIMMPTIKYLRIVFNDITWLFNVMVLDCSHSDTAYARNSHNGKWYHFDDSHVSETDENHLVVSSFL